MAACSHSVSTCMAVGCRPNLISMQVVGQASRTLMAHCDVNETMRAGAHGCWMWCTSDVMRYPRYEAELPSCERASRGGFCTHNFSIRHRQEEHIVLIGAVTIRNVLAMIESCEPQADSLAGTSGLRVGEASGHTESVRVRVMQ